MVFGICTAIKDEHLFLDEWLLYHISLGFTKIYLIEDFDSKSHLSITSKYPEVTLLSMADYMPESQIDKKLVTMFNAFILQHKRDIDWCLFIDIDEYLRLKQGWTLERLVSYYKDKYAICLNWKFYGANRLCKHRDTSIQELYSADYKKGYKWSEAFKSFVLMSKSQTFISPHRTRYIGRQMDLQFKMPNTYLFAWIDHYITKSWEDYCTLIFVRGDVVKGYRKILEFFSYNPEFLPHKKLLFKWMYKHYNVKEELLCNSSTLQLETNSMKK